MQQKNHVRTSTITTKMNLNKKYITHVSIASHASCGYLLTHFHKTRLLSGLRMMGLTQI